MNHRIRAWGIRRPDGTLAGTAMWGANGGGISIATFPTRKRARKKLKEMKETGWLPNNGRDFTVVPVKGTFEW